MNERRRIQNQIRTVNDSKLKQNTKGENATEGKKSETPMPLASIQCVLAASIASPILAMQKVIGIRPTAIRLKRV